MQAGKVFPTRYAIDFNVGNFYTPRLAPRCCHLLNFGPANGTIAAVWEDIEVISLPSERLDSPVRLRWKFEHPTISNNFVYLYQTPELSLPGIPYTNYRFENVLEFWYAGSKLADFLHYHRNFPMWDVFPDAFASVVSWNHLTNPAEFTDMGETQIYAASWEQQPEYHPYRH